MCIWMMESKVIIGIDPGTVLMGYGIIKIENKKLDLITMGALNLGKIDEHPEKLRTILDFVFSMVDQYKPDQLSIEAPFFGKNVQSMLKLGRAQGVAIAAAISRNIPIFEYSPRKIKQSITGNGNASKEQVAAMLQQMFSIRELPKDLDATDGLAVAVCHHFQNKISVEGKSYGSWKSFITQNPDRLK